MGWDGTKHLVPWDDFFVPSHSEPWLAFQLSSFVKWVILIFHLPSLLMILHLVQKYNKLHVSILSSWWSRCACDTRPTIFEKLSCIVFHKMKLILCKARLYKLISMLSNVKLVNPEFTSQNPVKFRKSRRNPKKIWMNPEKNPKISKKLWKSAKKCQKSKTFRKKFW